MDMKRKKIYLTIISLIIAVITLTGTIFAWLLQLRVSMFVYMGDVEISVKGWYQQATENVLLEYKDELKYANENLFSDLSTGQFIAFKFRVENKTERNALLSMRFSDFSEYIFENLKQYRSEINTTGTMSADIKSKITAAAESNTAKLTLIIDRIHYEYTDEAGNVLVDENDKPVDENGNLITGVRTPDKDMYLWKYSAGEKFIGNAGNDLVPAIDSIHLPGIKINPDTKAVTKTFLNLYFILNYKSATTAVEAYRTWLFGTEDSIGYGQKRCANILGYMWDDLSDPDKIIVNNYLAYFYEREIAAINPEEEELSVLNLALDYFEFIGENVPIK